MISIALHANNCACGDGVATNVEAGLRGDALQEAGDGSVES